MVEPFTGGAVNPDHQIRSAARRVTAPNLVTLIDDCDRRWNPEVILFESNARTPIGASR